MNKKYLLTLTAVVAALLLWVIPIQAAEGIQATLTATQSELTVGDPVELIIEVTHPAGYQVIMPELEQQWGNFEVWKQSQTETVPNPDGSETTRQTITVTLFEPGTFETPALSLTVSDTAGQLSDVLVNPTTLTVIPVLAEGDTTLADIRPQAGMDLPSLLPAVMLGLVVLAVMAAGSIWLYRRWRKYGFIDNRTPYQVAVDGLANIESMELPEKGQFKAHYTLVADCLRIYIEQQYQVNTTDRTTRELKQSLSQSTMDIEFARSFVDLFSDADFVKFAKLIPSIEEARQLMSQAKYLVEATKPKPETETKSSKARPQKVTGHTHVEVTQ